MKKLLIGLFAAFTLTACAGSNFDIGTSATRNTLSGIVNAYGIALSGETTYKNLCAKGAIPSSCRAVVVKLQAADAKAITAIEAANNFIKAYPTLNAANVVAAAQQAVASFQNVVASKSGS